ncbi:hypothetical protein HOLleu_15281 [Holothuria leucospilota]|uniref:Uncharacterized protein n=1 Tax=Holothuria leucospilota TaxID=206669 RepID=A0A9Q1HCC9_HOLLE|nr:hypothetical protein HOLleu_15281 [Holothuria leucospilota]
MDRDKLVCERRNGLVKCRGQLVRYDTSSGLENQAFCTKCKAEWMVSKDEDGNVTFDKRTSFRKTLCTKEKPVTGSQDLQRGDHVTWEEVEGRHHAIVENVADTSQVEVFASNLTADGGKLEIVQSRIDLTNSSLSLLEYDNEWHIYNPPEQVLLRARSLSIHSGTFNSDEQFATFCKTGHFQKQKFTHTMRELYEDVRIVYPTIFSLELLTNVLVLLLNILLSIFIETLAECGKCRKLAKLTLSPCSRRYWFLSEILLILFEGLVCLFYVIYQLYYKPRVKDSDNNGKYRTHTIYLAIPYVCEYVCAVLLASLSLFCNLRGTFCVLWCKVFIGTIFGVLGKLLGYVMGRVIFKRVTYKSIRTEITESYRKVDQNPSQL